MLYHCAHWMAVIGRRLSGFDSIAKAVKVVERDNGWCGIDCSIPSVFSVIRDWPKWLRPAQVDVPDNPQEVGNLVNLNAVVEKKRPLYICFMICPQNSSLLLEGRHFKFECINRIYDENIVTLWTDQLYGSQMAFYESILASSHRTRNGEETNFFFVPVLDSCIITLLMMHPT